MCSVVKAHWLDLVLYEGATFQSVRNLLFLTKMQSLTYLKKGNQFEYFTKIQKYKKLAKKNVKNCQKLPKTRVVCGSIPSRNIFFFHYRYKL